MLSAKGTKLFSATRTLAPGLPLIHEIKLQRDIAETDLLLRVLDVHGHEIISYQPKPRAKGEVPPPATEPPAPESIRSADELFITGLHLQQYRHATRCPTLYWREALRRDPQDSRCNNALGLWHLKRGEFAAAEQHFHDAIARLTLCNANPADGEAFYNLGICLRQLGRDDEAYAAFYKACWNQAWMAAGYHALAEIDSSRKQWSAALEHLERSLRFSMDNLRARNLMAIVLRRLNRAGEAAAQLKEALALDPLDWWARHLSGHTLLCDRQTALDLAHDYARAGLFDEAIALLKKHESAPGKGAALAGLGTGKNTGLPDQSWGALPLVHYTLGWLHDKRADKRSALKHFKAAAALPPDYCFPARLEEFAILETAMRANGKDARAPYYLGNWLYDRRRHDEAIKYWEISTSLDDNYSVVWRNLGIGYFNIRGNAGMARSAYDKAFGANPADARLLYERDQLWKRLRENPARRLRELEKHPALVQQRDDLTVELCALLNQSGRHVEAEQLLAKRNFQPWEGGEGGPLGQHVRTRLALGREALAHGDFSRAADHFQAALTSPANLGEAAHLLANRSNIHYWLGVAHAGLGEEKRARQHWLAAATFKGDFQEMKVRAFSEMTYYTALSLGCLGRRAKAKELFCGLLAYAQDLFKSPARIDYFATSLPTMLLFDDDLQYRQQTTALFLEAQARVGLDARAMAARLLEKVLRRDPNHAMASDLLTEIKEAGAATAAEHNGSSHPDLHHLAASRQGTSKQSSRTRTTSYSHL